MRNHHKNDHKTVVYKIQFDQNNELIVQVWATNAGNQKVEMFRFVRCYNLYLNSLSKMLLVRCRNKISQINHFCIHIRKITQKKNIIIM